MATATQLIEKFELQVSDVTELSDVEELEILNRVCHKIYNSRPWEFLKKEKSGSFTVSGTADASYVALPSDFGYVIGDYSDTDNSISTQQNSVPAVIFIGTTRDPYKLVNWSDRRQYLGKTGYAYIDIANSTLIFTGIPTSSTYSYDYIHVPTDLDDGDTPLIPNRFQNIIVYGMAVEDSVLQISPKATSYAPENQAKYESELADMIYWNAQLILN